MARVVPTSPEEGGAAEEKTIPSLVRDIVDDSITLAMQELQLFKDEVNETVRTSLTATIIIVAGLVAVILGVAFLGVTLILGLSEVMEPWMAALIVAAVFLIVGGIATYVGIQRFNKVTFAQQTQETLKENAEWLRNQTKTDVK